MTNQDGPEIILNLWYIHDEQGFIYSLRARAYFSIGTNSEKLELLKSCSDFDYLIADQFPVPERFYTNLGISGDQVPVAHASIMKIPGQRIALWEDAINQLQARLPVQTSFDIPKSPIVCITPLYGDDQGYIIPDYEDINLI